MWTRKAHICFHLSICLFSIKTQNRARLTLTNEQILNVIPPCYHGTIGKEQDERSRNEFLQMVIHVSTTGEFLQRHDSDGVSIVRNDDGRIRETVGDDDDRDSGQDVQDGGDGRGDSIVEVLEFAEHDGDIGEGGRRCGRKRD